jgi:mannosyltransferase
MVLVAPKIGGKMSTPQVYITNFNKNFTGVSATAAGVVSAQSTLLDLQLVGVALPGCPAPILKSEATSMCRDSPTDVPFAIWHVRRNTEMRAALWARDVLKRPIKIVFTSAAQRRHSAYPRWLISKMDAVIATSEEAASYVENVRAVVPHGVATERFIPATDRAEAWAAMRYGGRFGVACVGRIRPEKGTDIFVETMLRVLPQHPDMIALVIGKASREHRAFQQELKDKIAVNGLADRLLFVGEINADQMPRVMAAISLLVALPRYEGYGMTPLEALSCGTPFVASRTGHFEAFSNQGRCGTIVSIGDVDGAVTAVQNQLSDLDDVASETRDFVVENHSIVQEVAGINSVYQMLWDEADGAVR